jgi:ribosomal 30S subunit maturation factor RimM
VARDADGMETLVPAIRDVVMEVTPDAKRIVVRDVPGITGAEDAVLRPGGTTGS